VFEMNFWDELLQGVDLEPQEDTGAEDEGHEDQWPEIFAT